jgi:hypothetical protein
MNFLRFGNIIRVSRRLLFTYNIKFNVVNIVKFFCQFEAPTRKYIISWTDV